MRIKRFTIDAASPHNISFKLDHKNIADFLEEKIKEFSGQNVPWRDKRSLRIDFSELRKSLQNPGEYEIFTCQCGFPECVGVGSVIVVNLDSDAIVWTFKTPRILNEDGEFSSVGDIQLNLSRADIDRELRKYAKKIDYRKK